MIDFINNDLYNINSNIIFLNLNIDIKNLICSFYYNNLGYSTKEIKIIKNLKCKKKGTILRFLAELIYFKSTGTSVCWLKGCKKNGEIIIRFGAYSSINFELNRLKELNELNLISDDIYKNILKTIKFKKYFK